MSGMFNTIVISILLLLLIIQTIVHSRERKDLYNRLMSRDIHDYQRATRGDKQQGNQSPNKSSNWLHNNIQRAERREREGE